MWRKKWRGQKIRKVFKRLKGRMIKGKKINEQDEMFTDAASVCLSLL